MKRVEIIIDTMGAAFDGDPDPELQLVFDRIGDKIRMGDYLDDKWTNVRDTNGNITGQFRVTK